MESNRPWFCFILFLVVAFLLLMASLGALRFEKPEALPGMRWRQVHLVWDWNRMADWWGRVTPWAGPDDGEQRPVGEPLMLE